MLSPSAFRGSGHRGELCWLALQSMCLLLLYASQLRWLLTELILWKQPMKMGYCLGSMPEWLKGVDCKSTDESLHKFESYSAQESNFLNELPKIGELIFILRPFKI